MSNITRAEILKLAESQTDDFIKLVSDLIRIPSENPTGTQREVVDFVKTYLKEAGIDSEEVGCAS